MSAEYDRVTELERRLQAMAAELAEARQQQAATAEVLKVISRSPTDVAPVLQAIVNTACDVCDAYDAAVILREGDHLRNSAHRGPIALPMTTMPINRGWIGGRAVVDRKPVHVRDLSQESEEFPQGQEMARRMGHRAILAVPLLREGESIGAIVLRRTEAQPFSEKQIEVLQTFADQAVIAIGNVRLFEEVQARTRDLEEALHQQTATADVLKVISRSAFDLDAVLTTLLTSAFRLSEADGGTICLRDGDAYRYRSTEGAGASPQFRQFMAGRAVDLGRGSISGRVILSGKVEQISDLLSDPEYQLPIAATGSTARALIGVPLLREDRVEGVFALTRSQPGYFTARQIELVQTFADQAVIAIENTRLFDEVQARTHDLTEALQMQTATSDVLKVISRSAFDLQRVFDALISSAVELCGAHDGAICVREGDAYRYRASAGTRPDWEKVLAANPPKPGRGSVTARVLLTGQVQNVHDVLEDPEYALPIYTENQSRSVLGVPLLRDDRVEGALLLARLEPGPFSQRQVELVKTFADQAVIAIENVRLFDEVQARTRELQDSLERQQASAEILRVISASPTDVKPVFDAIALTAVRLFNLRSAAVFRVEGATLAMATIARGNRLLAEDEFHPPEPIDPNENYPSRAMAEKRTLYVKDFGGVEVSERQRAISKARGFSSGLFMPLLRGGDCIGVFLLTAPDTDHFTDKDIALAESFRDQAQIAIENTSLFRETQEALQQQTATSDVLKVISRSAFDLNPVLSTLVESASALCDAPQSAIMIRDGDVVRLAEQKGYPEDFIAYLRENPLPVGPGSGAGNAAYTGDVAHFPDILADPDYRFSGGQRLGGYRALLSVPLLREKDVIGVFSLGRPTPGPFTERQIELVKTFADQAVIAIENVRLFEEVQARTRDLTEALQMQTATSDVLKVISRSAFDLDAVLDTLIESARKLCEAPQGMLLMRDGPVLRMTKQKGYPDVFERWVLDNPQPPSPYSGVGRAALTGEVAHFPDVKADPDYRLSRGQQLGGYRALVSVPLLREGEVLGVFSLGRPTPGSFTDRQIELVKTFADQAVIAIENVRLFDEVQARTRDLTEALEQQTATADVLKAISRTAFDLDTVLESLISTAVRLCEAKYGEIFRRQGDVYRFAASLKNAVPGYVEHEAAAEIRPGRGTLVGRVVLERRAVQIADAWNDPEYGEKDEARMGDVRSMLGVPLMRDGEPIGAFALARSEPIPFTRRQVELVTTFADQAVIAIENVRLFDEVQARTRDLAEALQMQTATADVLKVISRSAFDLQTVFNTLVSSAVELGGALTGTICVRDGDVYRYRDTVGAEFTSALAQYLRDHPAVPGRATIAGRVLLSGKVERIPDCLADPEYVVPMGSLATNVRSLLGVPLLRNEGVEGAIILTRAEPGDFTLRQIEIVQTFADQAVIALENVRLFDEVQARTRELAASLDNLRRAQDRLVQSEKLASLGQLTAGIAHEIKNPLNFVNNFSALSRELLEEMRETLAKAPLGAPEREEIDELLGMLDSNLDKVVNHGKRADSIVKNMLLHSREGSGVRAPADVNAMVEEALNLAYHGARAEKPGFNVDIVKTLDSRAGEAEIYAQEINRVLLNLISNAFYATTKRKQHDPAHEPTITAATRDLGDFVEIAIRDNGVGISEEVRTKMFNPFFTTKPAGEGTGLGLSLSHDIVVKQHGGSIDVATELGAFTQFTIRLPRKGTS